MVESVAMTRISLVTYVIPKNMGFQVEELLNEDGTSPYADWFNSLDAVAAAKVTVANVRMEAGNVSSVEWFRGIGEFKINWGRVCASIWRGTAKN